MPDSLQSVLALLRTVGVGPLVGAAVVLILLRVATPDALRGAIGRLYADICPLVRDYWRARIDARVAEADRDRTITEHWRGSLLAPHPKSPTSTRVDVALPGAGDDAAGGVGSTPSAMAPSETNLGRCSRAGCPFRVGEGSDGVVG